jgi:hypothetical protein
MSPVDAAELVPVATGEELELEVPAGADGELLVELLLPELLHPARASAPPARAATSARL